MVSLLTRKCLLSLVMFVAVLLLQGCSDGKPFDEPEFWQTATADDMKSVMDDWRDSEGRDGDYTPLHYAVLYDAKPELVVALLDYGADVNARYENRFFENDGRTPLHLAIDSVIVETLLDRGADIEARDAKGATPLH